LPIPDTKTILTFGNAIIANHSEAIKQCKSDKKIKTQRRNVEINRDKNYLLIGDNLTILNKMKVKDYFDICYIDPPYNTRKKMGKYKDNFVSHESWVEFMHPRLVSAVSVLKKNGLIFISIGIDELAYLRILCDKVFGEDNFISCILSEFAFY
jgi:adenine-specific DNA-methyltransferase